MKAAAAAVALLLVIGLAAFAATSLVQDKVDDQAREQRHDRQERKAERLYRAQVAGCRRGNIVRREVNKRGHVLKRFLVTAAEAREQTAQLQRAAGQTAEAEVNEKAADYWRHDLASDVDDIELPFCPTQFPRPRARG